MGGGKEETAPFLSKTYEMVDDPATDTMVSWTLNNSGFVVWNVPEFARLLLPKFFKHNNFSSFVRQLNTYGFRKVPERWEFVNEGFIRGHKQLLKSINRRKPPCINNNPAKACVGVGVGVGVEVGVGKFGIEDEVEGLKRDKNVLVQQLVRLRQQQQSTDTQLHTVGQRVQVMEQKQQQMMSFLAKAMHSPALLSQLVQNQTDVNRHIAGVGKKRSLPNHDPHIPGMQPDGHIVNYQPLINEAAKSMLRQILKLNVHLPDHSLMDPNAFLLHHLPAASNVLNNPTSASRITGVTLSQVSQTSQQETGFPTNLASEMKSKLHSSTCETRNLANPLGDAIMSNLNHMNQMQGVVPDSTLLFPDMTISGTQNSALSFLDSLSSVQDGTLPMEEGELDGILPGSNDAFWEQFFPVCPLSEATEEVDSSGTAKENELGQGEGLEKLHHINHLTEQMGLLTAETDKV